MDHNRLKEQAREGDLKAIEALRADARRRGDFLLEIETIVLAALARAVPIGAFTGQPLKDNAGSLALWRELMSVWDRWSEGEDDHPSQLTSVKLVERALETLGWYDPTVLWLPTRWHKDLLEGRGRPYHLMVEIPENWKVDEEQKVFRDDWWVIGSPTLQKELKSLAHEMHNLGGFGHDLFYQRAELESQVNAEPADSPRRPALVQELERISEEYESRNQRLRRAMNTREQRLQSLHEAVIGTWNRIQICCEVFPDVLKLGERVASKFQLQGGDGAQDFFESWGAFCMAPVPACRLGVERWESLRQSLQAIQNGGISTLSTAIHVMRLARFEMCGDTE